MYKAWTDPKQFARWFPPDGFSADCELDVRPGGAIRADMKGEDPALGPDFFRKVFPGKGVYKEVVPNERLADGLRQSLDKLTALLLEGNDPDKTADVKGRNLTLTRVFDAPCDLVWTAYTDPTHIVKWMFAADWESPFAETDVRPGGKFWIGMRPADHSEEGFVFDGTYREAVKPERLVQAISDGRLTTTFTDVGGKTKLTVSVEMAESEENAMQGRKS